MRRKGMIVLAAIATLAIGVSSAFAAQSYSTKIQLVGLDGTAGDAILYGNLNTNSKCLGPRAMALSKKTASGFKLVDQDYSSANGAWAFEGNVGPLPSTLRVEVAKAKLKKNGVVKAICKPDSVQFSLTPAKLAAGAL